jgi:hypothetical protein
MTRQRLAYSSVATAAAEATNESTHSRFRQRQRDSAASTAVKAARFLKVRVAG